MRPQPRSQLEWGFAPGPVALTAGVAGTPLWSQGHFGPLVDTFYPSMSLLAPAHVPCPSPAPSSPVARSSSHQIFPWWPRQDELGSHQGSAALGSLWRELEEAMGTEGTLSRNGPWWGSAMGDPWHNLPSHPPAGDSVEAISGHGRCAFLPV